MVRLSSFSVIIVFAGMMLTGLALFPRLGVQLQPSADMPSLSISFSWPNTPAVVVEREVTSMIEGAMNTMRKVEQISSVSFHGSGIIHIRFNTSIDIEMMRFEVASKIRRIYNELPDGVNFPVIMVNRATGRQSPLLTYNIIAPETGNVMDQYFEQHILPALLAIRGVDRISFYGGSPMEYQVIYDPEMLRLVDITKNDLLAAINNRFAIMHLGMALPGGSCDQSGLITAKTITQYKEASNKTQRPMASGKLLVMLRAGQENMHDWQTTPVGNFGGRVIHLNDVAEMRHTEGTPERYYRINGQGANGMRVFAAAGENQVRLAAAVKNKVAKMQQYMPDGWQVMLTYDDTEYIRKDMKRLGLRMLFSLSILMLFVLLVTQKPRYLLLIVITTLANLLIAITWYHFFNIDMHLYSLAGITVSFGIIIDNVIVMIEHMRHHNNRKVFPAILAATLTTAGCLSVVFLLEPKHQALLRDFAGVMLVNLLISLVIAWFLAPALFERFGMNTRIKNPRSKRRLAKLNRFYYKFLLFARHYKWLFIVFLILGFGLPVHRLPAHITNDSKPAWLYNHTIGSKLYQEKMKNTTEKLLGGSFRLFSKYVFSGAYIADSEHTAITISGQMPDGANIHQLNQAFLIMEQFLLQQKGIELFETRILSPQNGTINVFIDASYVADLFPVYLQEKIIGKALTIGGVDWRVDGTGKGFSNAQRGHATKHSTIILEGYNYDQLYHYAELLQIRASENPRVSNANIMGGGYWGRNVRTEFNLSFNNEQLAYIGLPPFQIYSYLTAITTKQRAATIYHNNQSIAIKLIPCSYDAYTFYDFTNRPLYFNGISYKSGNLLSIGKQATGNNIHKHDQQYRLHLSYNFIGPHLLERRVRDVLINDFNLMVPTGYRAHEQEFSWSAESRQHFLLILLVVVIIYFVCCILLESLIQPLAVISLIPVSFIGLFLTFYFFNLDFDQGGIAAFVLLSGLSVNAGLYVLNDYNGFVKRFTNRDVLRLYLKAFQHKVFPVILTISSTVIGLLPFVIGHHEAFWFAFAAGTMGGVFFSVVGIMLVFPLFVARRAQRTRREILASHGGHGEHGG